MCHKTIKIIHFPPLVLNFSFWIIIHYSINMDCEGTINMDLLWNLIFGIDPWDKLSFLMFFLSTIFSGLWGVFFPHSYTLPLYHLLILLKTPTIRFPFHFILFPLCTQVLVRQPLRTSWVTKYQKCVFLISPKWHTF